MTKAKLKEIVCFIDIACGNETASKIIKDSVISLVSTSYTLGIKQIVESEDNVGINTILEMLRM
jgi:hypothetical protein